MRFYKVKYVIYLCRRISFHIVLDRNRTILMSNHHDLLVLLALDWSKRSKLNFYQVNLCAFLLNLTPMIQLNLPKCQRWLCVRIVFLSFLVLVSIYKLSSQNYYGFDGMLDVLKIYSVYEILMVKKFIDNHTPDIPILPK